MQFCVKRIFPQYDFTITGASYAGKPRNNTMMYITGKVEHLVENLYGHRNCLCFVENGMYVPKEISDDNAVICCENPAYSYACFAAEVQDGLRKEEQAKGYKRTDAGYYTGVNVKIGRNAYIEPNVLIGHEVEIGDNAVIMSGSVIKHAMIGDNFLCNENAVIGDYSFTQAEDSAGNKFRIPAMGRVIIGNHVEVGACNDVAMGACGDTVLEDYVKLDGLVHIGHEAYLCRNVEVTAGAIVAGFVELNERSYLGVNSCIRNRISIGSDAVIGMGAVVTKSVESGMTIAGNPAKLFQKVSGG